MLKKHQLKLNTRGSVLVFADNHSASNIGCLVGNENNEFPQKSVPKPINISRLIYPTKILANDNKNKGKAILKGDSCIDSIAILDPLTSRKKVNEIKRVE